jgi:hypothetical protein
MGNPAEIAMHRWWCGSRKNDIGGGGFKVFQNFRQR